MKKWSKKRKVLVGVLVALLLVILLAVAFIWGKLNKLQYDSHTAGTSQQTEEQASEKNKDVINILLVGTDERSEEFSENARSDSMILASLNKKTKTIHLVSLERGMGVPVLEGPYAGEYDWLTHIFRYGGADLLMRTVRECFKVDVDRYVRVNFAAVTRAVDVLGGIDMELSAAEAEYMGHGMQPGMNHLDGKLALSYSRMRAPDSDWHRVERQRKVIVACFDKVRDSNLLELNNLADELLPLVRTNLTKGEITNLMLTAPRFLSADVEQMTIPVKDSFGSMEGMGGRILFDVDFDTNNAILHEFLYGTEDK